MRTSEKSVPNNILIKISEADPEKKWQDALYQKYRKKHLICSRFSLIFGNTAGGT